MADLTPHSPAAKATGKGSPAGSAGQVVMVFQGGGALGAYQAGVYQALYEAGVEPDWVVGTSIGAINACLIAGNTPEERVPRLKEFWRLMTFNSLWDNGGAWPQLRIRWPSPAGNLHWERRAPDSTRPSHLRKRF